MLEEEFTQLINQFGVSVTVNDETKSRKAILSSQNVSDASTLHDDRIIHTNWKLQRGMIIHYNNNDYLILSDVQAKRDYEYKALMRPMLNGAFEFTYMTGGIIIDHDRYGNPIYKEGHKPKEVTEPVPCLIKQQGIPAIEYGQITTLNKTIIVTLQDNSISEQITKTSKHDVFNHTYTVEDILLHEVGLRKLVMTW